MNKEAILMVDDDLDILNGYKRLFRKQFNLETALGPELGLEKIKKQNFTVVVSDLNMPVMDGIQFLTKVKDLRPDCVRIMLTGNADIEKAIHAVNEGNVFRFLTKPCPDGVLIMALNDGIQQHHLITAERELLERTLRGSVDILTEILSFLHPDIFGRTMMLRARVRALGEFFKIKSSWEIEVAAMLSPIGFVSLPPEILLKIQKKNPLPPGEEEMVKQTPEIGAFLLRKIPRLSSVSKIIHYQKKNFDGSGFPNEEIAGDEIPLGARILRVLDDMLELEQSSKNCPQALEILKSRSGFYDPKVLQKVEECFLEDEEDSGSLPYETISLRADELREYHTLASDLITNSGHLLLSSGEKLSSIHMQRLRNYRKLEGIKEPILVKKEPTP